MVGGALGLAVLATIVAAVSGSATASGASTELSALATGYHTAFFIGAGFCLVATLLAAGLKLQKNMIGPGH
jgi:hypothetical protein